MKSITPLPWLWLVESYNSEFEKQNEQWQWLMSRWAWATEIEPNGSKEWTTGQFRDMGCGYNAQKLILGHLWYRPSRYWSYIRFTQGWRRGGEVVYSWWASNRMVDVSDRGTDQLYTWSWNHTEKSIKNIVIFSQEDSGHHTSHQGRLYTVCTE